MKKFIQLLFTLVLAAGLLLGCSNDTTEETDNTSTENQTQSEETQEQAVHITISEDIGEEVLSEKDIEIEEGAILMDVLKDNYEIEEDGGFITGIDGVTAEDGEEKYWMYEVNGEMAEVGANEYELEAGDDVVFDLHAVE